ncbi:hypothetical protein HDU76_013843 [Blyttiomyces sp. JEL0837]|nr:hypothetical protein HDU76_013843 [Blyttiomyces sp. JEL0837]
MFLEKLLPYLHTSGFRRDLLRLCDGHPTKIDPNEPYAVVKKAWDDGDFGNDEMAKDWSDSYWFEAVGYLSGPLMALFQHITGNKTLTAHNLYSINYLCEVARILTKTPPPTRSLPLDDLKDHVLDVLGGKLYAADASFADLNAIRKNRDQNKKGIEALYNSYNFGKIASKSWIPEGYSGPPRLG